MDLTSYDDCARFVAEAVANPNQTGDLAVVSNELSVEDFVKIYNETTGRKVVAKKAGTIEKIKK